MRHGGQIFWAPDLKDIRLCWCCTCLGKRERVQQVDPLLDRGTVGGQVEAAMRGTMGLDGLINCDSEEITVCLTDEPHLNVEVEVGIQGSQVLTFVGPYDTGSQLSFLDYEVVKTRVPHWLKMAKPFGLRVRGAGGDSIPTYGVVTLICKIAGKQLSQDFVIASIVEPVLH